MKINVKKLLKNPDVIGWVLWLVIGAALYPLCIHLMFKYTYDQMPIVTRYIVGIFMAAMLSGVISVGINDLWHRMRRKKPASRRKDGKKAEKGRAR